MRLAPLSQVSIFSALQEKWSGQILSRNTSQYYCWRRILAWLPSLGTGCVSQKRYTWFLASRRLLGRPWPKEKRWRALWISCCFFSGRALTYDRRTQERRSYWGEKGLVVTGCHGSRDNLSKGSWFQSVETTEFSSGSFTAFTPHVRTQTMAKGSLGPSDLQVLSFFCFFLFCCFTPLPSAVIVLSLEDSLKRRRSCTKDSFTEQMRKSEKTHCCRTYGFESVIVCVCVCGSSAAVRALPHVGGFSALISASREGWRVTAWLADTGPPSP